MSANKITGAKAALPRPIFVAKAAFLMLTHSARRASQAAC